jgi:hypothetical protein
MKLTRPQMLAFGSLAMRLGVEVGYEIVDQNNLGNITVNAIDVLGNKKLFVLPPAGGFTSVPTWPDTGPPGPTPGVAASPSSPTATGAAETSAPS